MICSVRTNNTDSARHTNKVDLGCVDLLDRGAVDHWALALCSHVVDHAARF